MFKLARRRPSPTMVVAGLALFAGMGGVAVAAPGPFLLESSNSATAATSLTAPVNGAALALTNTSTAANATPLALKAGAGRPPLTVDSTARVNNLNADQVDNLSATAFVQRGVAHSNPVTTAGGVVDVTNTGSTNGVQGRTTAPGASGVYGEHSGPGGYGVAGRAGDDGNAVFGENTGTGWAGYFVGKVHMDGKLDCNGCLAAKDVVGKVADADSLDGIDSAGFVQGSGGAVGQAIAEFPGQSNVLGPAMFGAIQLQYACPANVSGNGTLLVWNRTSGPMNVFIESATANPRYFDIAPGGPVALAATATADMFHIQAQGAPGVMTIEAAIVHRPYRPDCHAQAQGVLTR